jgi:hypothetical protein
MTLLARNTELTQQVADLSARIEELTQAIHAQVCTATGIK